MSKIATAKQREVQRIVDALSIAIAQHRLKPGMRLVEAQIVEVLQANRNHVQAALQRMALQHIVTIEPNRGAMVAQPEAREAREVFIARRAIESAIVACITPENMAQYQSEFSAQQQAERVASEQEDRRDIVRELSQFHLLLANVSGNKVLSEILSNLMVRSSLIVALYQRNDIPSCQCAEHAAIITALKAGDSALAQSIMIAHLNELEQQLDLADAAPDQLNLRQALLTS
ncbi:GntR family transcriptional regulator [Erwiniaceae bacterium BAC15a-03b]|uniref:GntR family transcriptional regulator n=1 Tax=Winslowiella arboricola TaxID=2978220 RepID=A0A9J6PMF3_9GAMM|nr:GntR family transcriptional regulator [Winslowiella arboricola]MCU5772086.1 GntR family transcriptional regulator [Winslowiella arboricola]MCU5778578.1 GntR family transcriptional regulator [Winslowiella arboricola]